MQKPEEKTFDFDIDAAEKALHEPLRSDIMMVAQANTKRTCRCPKCESWIPCKRDIPDFCTCPNCGSVH